MKHSNEGSAFAIGLTINDLLHLEGFPEVHSVEGDSIRFTREIDMNMYNLCYAMAYRIWEQKQNENEK
jgi:hypothetical protein